MSRSNALALVLALLAPPVLAGPSPAADGVLDPTFGVGGDSVVAFDRGLNNRDIARAVVVDAEDRIYMVGEVDVPGSRRIGVTRLRADGDIDATYGVDGDGRVVAPAAGTAITASSAVMDSQGHLLVAGAAVVSGSDTQFVVCRFSPAGSLATFEGSNFACATVDFDLGGADSDEANAIAVQPDGKIVLAGSASTAVGTTLAIARLNPDGSLDDGFGINGRATFVPAGYDEFVASAVHLLPDGSLLAAGHGVTVANLTFGVIVHIDEAGGTDMEFGNNPGFTRSPSSATRYVDVAWDASAERFVAIGNYTAGVPEGLIICHLPNGGPVTCPGGNGASVDVALGAGVILTDLLRQSDGRLLIAGTWVPQANGPARTLLLRVRKGLQLDTADFNAPQGYIGHSYGDEQDFGLGVAVQRSRIVIAGTTKYTNSANYDFAASGYLLDRIFASGFDD